MTAVAEPGQEHALHLSVHANQGGRHDSSHFVWSSAPIPRPSHRPPCPGTARPRLPHLACLHLDSRSGGTAALATTVLNVIPGATDEIVMASAFTATGILGHLAPLSG